MSADLQLALFDEAPASVTLPAVVEAPLPPDPAPVQPAPEKVVKPKRKKKAKLDDTPPPEPWNLNKARQDNLESMRCCWPEWEGPRVEDSIHGMCQVGPCCAFNMSKGRVTYLYCVPLKILDVSGDGNTILGAIAYPETERYKGFTEENGELVLLDLWEVWPPVNLLVEQRHEEEKRRKAEQPPHETPPQNSEDAETTE